jgi:hypothetical protein
VQEGESPEARGSRQATPICGNNRPTELAANALLNFLSIGAATISHVHTANENCSGNGFFRGTVASILCLARGFNFAGRPNNGLAFRAPQPPRRWRASQPSKIRAVTVNARATEEGLSPARATPPFDEPRSGYAPSPSGV